MSLILYVEDDAVLQIAGQMALEDAGYEVLAAGDGQQAFEHLKARGGEVGTLITDVGLPGRIDGWDVADLARTIAGAVRVIYVTAADSADFAARGVVRSRLVAKPFEWNQVLRMACELDGASPPVAPELPFTTGPGAGRSARH
ncbi:MAG: two-component response regulator [Caulobacteraceae bacterium]|nr:two-component response regulator [Caulobacteraceae bacterium]